MKYHDPVLLRESVEALNIEGERKKGVYVDATFGGGGHSRAILEQLSDKGRLFGFDQDEDVLPNIPEDSRFTFVQNNFRYLQRFLKLYGVSKVDGILADLGISSHQIDEAERGFSYRYDAMLDMRMNREGELKASDVVNQYSCSQLQELFSAFGQVRNARTLAKTIEKERVGNKIETIRDFMLIVEPLARGNKQRYFSQVFQALRIEVNDEVNALKDFLKDAMNVLGEEGRLVVISYHSVEDKLVKNFLKSGDFEGVYQKDFFGNIYRPFVLVAKKAVVPSREEIASNPRARSAKMRVGARTFRESRKK